MASEDKSNTSILSGLRPYDLKWDVVGEEIHTNLKRPERCTFVDYSRAGLHQSQKGTYYIRMETMFKKASDELEEGGISGVLSAAEWVTEVCTRLAQQARPYITKEFMRLKFSMTTNFNIEAENGVAEIQDSKEGLFQKSITFFPSKYTKFYRIEDEKEVGDHALSMLQRNNSFYRIDLSLKSFQFRYFEADKKVLVRCFVNVPSMTYLDEPIPGVVPIIVEKLEEKRAQKTHSLLEILRRKKRKVE